MVLTISLEIGLFRIEAINWLLFCSFTSKYKAIKDVNKDVLGLRVTESVYLNLIFT
jgi:hypothetical protein